MPILITGMFGPSGGAGSFNLYDPADMAAGDVDVLIRLIAGGRIYTNGIAGEIVIQTGAGTPSHAATEGVLYWDTAADILYCNNNGATGWTAVGTSSAGTPGPMGPPGLDGADGQDGWPIPGPAGVAGTPGAAGLMGVPGMDGADGQDGYPIPGPPGAAGAAGSVGPAGVGLMGPPGMDGADGVEGFIMLAQPNRSYMFTGTFYAVPESTTVPKLIIGPLPFAGTFVKLTIYSRDVAAESAIRVDIHKRTAANEDSTTSTTVFTTQTNRPTIAATHYAGNTTTFEVPTFAKGDWLDFYLDVDDSGITTLYFGLEITPT